MLNIRAKSVLVFVMLVGLFLFNTQYTDADIFAERNVANNRFSARTLNFFVKSTVNNNDVNYLYKTTGIIPGGYDLTAAKIKKDADASFKYQLKAVKTNGDDGFCNNLNVSILKRNLSLVYSGNLLTMNLNSQIADNPEDWIFLLSFDRNDPVFQNKICEFNFVFRTYRNSPDETGGIYARRIIGNVVSSGSW